MSQLNLLRDWLFHYNGSTRASGLMRILLGLLILYRFEIGAKVGFSSYGVLPELLFYAVVGCMIFGIFSRPATLAAGLFVMWTYYYRWVFLHDRVWAHHHTYLLGFATLLLAFAPCGKSYAVDRWLAVRRAVKAGHPLPAEEGNLFAHRLIAVQMAVLYFYAFWDKIFIANTNHIFYNFLNGARLEQIIMFHYWGSGFHIEPYMSAVAAAAAITVAIVELLLPLLLVERFQKWLVVPGIGLHIAFYVLLPLQTYSLTCIVLYLAIFNANKVHAWIEMLSPPRRAEPAFA